MTKCPTYNHTRGDSQMTPCPICMLIEVVEAIRLEPDNWSESAAWQSPQREQLIERADEVIGNAEAAQ